MQAPQEKNTEKGLEDARKLKEEGNKYYREGDFVASLEKYLLALQHLDEANPSEEDQITAKKHLYVLCNLNLGAVGLKINKPELTVKSCSLVLELDPNNVKALYRRGMAKSALADFQGAKADLTKALTLQPTSDMEAIEEELQRLDSKILTDNDILKLYQFNQDTNDDINEKFRANEGPNSRFKANLSIPRISYLDPSLSRFLQLEVPVILSGSRLCRTAVGRWDIDYLERHMGSTAEFSVFSSPFPKFMYFDEAKNLGNFEFIPTTTKMTVTFSQFAKLVRQEKEGRNQCNHQQEEEKRTYYYLQQTLNQGVGDQIVEDFKGFDWDWVYGWQNRMGWGKLKFNTLWVGMEGVYTPTHYDEAHNFFGQVQGRKKFILFPPSQFPNLYVFPYHHPADRQSQVDIDYPDYTKFPLFREAQGLEGVVEAGDVLYLPPYWFHHVISLDETVSINFWFEMGQVDASRLTFPLNDSQKMAVRRNVEKMIGQVVGPSEVGKFLRELTVGRWDDLPQKKPTSKEGEKGEETSK